MKRAISLFMSIAMLVSAVLCVDLSAFASELTINNRAAWLSTLVSTFDMTVESDNYPDNYFSDLTEDSEYYRDILVATEYGLISVEAGDPIYPEDEITREFAAQTLNACLGFQLETNEDGEYDYTFADAEECSFPDDDQIAINRGWFELVDGNFCPGNVVTTTEITAMLDDAKAQIEITNVDENYDSTVEVADGVVEIPNGTELSIDENGTITVVNCPVTINEGDSFTAYFYDLPNAYVAQSVTVDGNKTIIATQEANTEEVFENVDIQEVSQIDDAEFIPAEGFTVEPDSGQASTFALSRESTPINSLNNVKIGGDITVDGIKLALSAKLSNPVLETKISNKNTYIGLNTDVELSYSVSTKTSSKLDPKNKKVVPVGYINILGVGYFKVSFEITLSGGITIKEKFNLTMGESYADGEDLRIIADFTHKDFSIAVEATLKAGYKFELGISIAIVKADVYASVGFAVKGTFTGYPSGTPSTCLNISGYMYLDIGAELTINLFFTSLHFGAEKAIIDSKNSPVKFAFHFEDGKKVHECTRGKTPKYLTPSDSKHSNSADDCVNTYENVDSSSFRYSVSNGDATITGYTGSSSVVVIPEYIDGYKVTSIGDDAFYGCTNLTSVTIPNSVTSIGNYAFEDCANLTSITIPNSVTSIGSDAFYNCTSLTSVIISNSVTSIGDSAFQNCESLTSVIIPNSVTSIGEHAFCDCTSLTSVTIGNGVTNIGDDAFYYCTSLTSITIPDSVTSIGDGAFSSCTSLTSVTIGNGVTSIGYEAFFYCTSLTSVTIPNSVTSIGDDAFSWCESLTSVTIGNSVTSIGGAAFENCESLTNVTIPNSVKSIGSYAFAWCTSLKNVTIGNSVTSIGDYAFSNCTSLTSVILPNSVTSIGNYAFDECSGLTSVTIGNSVTSIGDGAFSDCTSLTSVTIPNSVTSIGAHAFEYCESLTSVTIGNSATSIGDYAFRLCESLTSVTIPNSVTRIGVYAFYSCTSLTSVTIPNSVTSIGSYAFAWCTSLTSVTIPNSVASIGDEAFYNCTSLTSVIIPDSVTSIGFEAFYNCDILTSVTIPNSVTSIGDDAFYNCTRITDVYYSGSQEQWNKISIGSHNEYLRSANIHYNYIPPCDVHTPDTAVKENVKKATCTAAGSYDSVVYCSVCNIEISRTKKTVAKTAHTYKTTTTKATTSKNGSVVTKCTVCGAVKSKSTIYYPKTVTLSATGYTYDGKVKKPSVTVKDRTGKKLVKNTDYTVTYPSGRKNVGKYAVKITFKGKYSGTKTLYFTIKPKSTSISSLKAGSKKFTVKWYKRTTQTTGYQVQYSTSSKFTSPKTVTISKTGTTSKTVSKLKAKKRYYVRVRTYKTVNGTRYYSSWSKARYVTTKS